MITQASFLNRINDETVGDQINVGRASAQLTVTATVNLRSGASLSERTVLVNRFLPSIVRAYKDTPARIYKEANQFEH